jgi:exosortase J
MAENSHLAAPVLDAEESHEESLSLRRSRFFWGCGIAFLAAAGALGIFRELATLWMIWNSDPLRSIGMLIPPISILLTLLAWRQSGWQRHGTWWGLAIIGLSYLLSLLRFESFFMVVFGEASISLIPVSLPVYVYGSGVILLFAGMDVWRRTWFPIGLLLLSQPVPILTSGLIDLPLQSISAGVVRSFATLIHFAPTTPQLRLMFSPDFGMFIAPGCEGIRGAVAMGYVALVLGYLKRLPSYLWVGYVGGAVLLGYFFNFIRLCLLVLYYRVAAGHRAFEDVAKQADYVIGTCLFLIATLMFLWLARRERQDRTFSLSIQSPVQQDARMRDVGFKYGAFAMILLTALLLPSSVLNHMPATSPPIASLALRMPNQVGNFTLEHIWYEQQGGTPLVESGAYSAKGFDEITLGIWISPQGYIHDAESCWLARGLVPKMSTVQQFEVAGGRVVRLNTWYYSDANTDSIVANAICTPERCSLYQALPATKQFGLVFLTPRVNVVTESGEHLVSIMVRIDRLHTSESESATYEVLTSEAQKFLAGLDLNGLSRSFQ